MANVETLAFCELLTRIIDLIGTKFRLLLELEAAFSSERDSSSSSLCGDVRY